jgi:uncharacterized protein YqeY
MSIKETLQADLKTSMLARDSFTTDVLKGLKTAIQYEEVAKSKREEGLSDDEILGVFKKESKKRQDSIDMYTQGNNLEQADKETKEKAIIDAYLPAQLSEDQVNELIDSALGELGISEPTRQDMGKIMGAVKVKGGSSLDGSMLAKLVNQRIGA